jgi:hypothetical protein
MLKRYSCNSVHGEDVFSDAFDRALVEVQLLGATGEVDDVDVVICIGGSFRFVYRESDVFSGALMDFIESVNPMVEYYMPWKNELWFEVLDAVELAKALQNMVGKAGFLPVLG